MFTKSNSSIVIIFLVGMLSSQLTWSLPSVGHAIMAKGDVTAQSNSQSPRKILRRSPVYEADVVRTGKSSFTVLQFLDKTKLSIRPESELSITQYRMNRGNQNKEQDQVGIELIKGGLRILTGVIAKETPRNFYVRGRAGQIGIRGTEFDLRQCDKECAIEQAHLNGLTEPDANTPPGLYAAVYVGGITGYKNGKKLDAGPGQAIYFSEDTMKLLDEIPLFLSQDITPKASTLIDELNAWEEDFADDLEMGVLEGPVLQPLPLTGVEHNGMPELPIYEQEPADVQEDFLPESEPVIEPVEEIQDESEGAEPEEVVEPDEPTDDPKDVSDDPVDPPPIIIL
ncbi:MAG: hypothetical protein ACI8P9_001749 [Parasphingorhabdus sp.]|jgi:hypothetical protein